MPEYYNLIYDRNDHVTKGQFGTIFHGKWRDNVQVTIERVEKNWFSIDLEAIRKTQDHPNIICCYGTSVESDFL